MSFKPTYPATKTTTTVDEYFGVEVADPYRWLEDDLSEETSSWVEAQNNVTERYLNQIPYRDKIRHRLTALWDYQKTSCPFQEGNYLYFYQNDGLQNQSVVYRQKAGGKAEVFLDPNSFSEDGTKSLDRLSFSKDGKLAAYSISDGGSDWRSIVVINTDSGEQVEPPLTDVKFSGISWQGNQGFYYSSYDKPEGSHLSAKTAQHKLYFHQLNKAQSTDKVIFGNNPEEHYRYVHGEVTEDGNYLVISCANSTSGNKLFLLDLREINTKLLTISDDIDSNTWMLGVDKNHLLLTTDQQAPNNKVVSIDPTQPDIWTDVIAESENVLTSHMAGGHIFAEYLKDACSYVLQYDYTGKLIRELPLPGSGSVLIESGKEKDSKLYYAYSNYITPVSIFEFDIASGELKLHRKPAARFDPEQYTSEQVFYQSKDGTRIPMTISYKKGLRRSSKNPTILYGYGGFNISLTPEFNIANALWMELGGIYAVANLRGGGEYGRSWHDAGILQQKQNVFDDFISAAEYLINESYTSTDFLAIRGGSNGGLLVGAVMNQRPDLIKVALPAVGVMDMLRYHKFTAGAGWAYDYGTAEQSEAMFNYLKGYSPLHNVQNDKSYPATLVTTADHDDRVVPAHSFKFAAQLQNQQTGQSAKLIRIETRAGHGQGTPAAKQIEQLTDLFSFTLFNMGIETVTTAE